jgi:hypothetical protein
VGEELLIPDFLEVILFNSIPDLIYGFFIEFKTW